MKKHFAIFSVLVLITFSLTGQSLITTAGNGNWSSTSTWTGGVLPGTNDTVDISHQVTLDIDDTCAMFRIKSGGELIINDSGDTLATSATGGTEHNLIESGGTLTMSSGTINTKTDFTVNGTLTISGGTLNIGDNRYDNLFVNGEGTVDGAILNLSGGTINIKGRYVQYNGGSASLFGNAVLNACIGGNQNNSYSNVSVRGSGKFEVASGSSAQFIIKNGNNGTGKTLYYSPATSKFEGGSFIIDETENINLIVSSDMPIYKIESKVTDTLTIVNRYGRYDTLDYLAITSGTVRIDTSTYLLVKGGITGATSSNFIIGSDTLSNGTISNASFIYLGSGSVNAKVERFIDAWVDAAHGWHYIASPVTNQAISTEFVNISGSPISSDVDFYRWSETEDLWINIKNTSGNYNQGSATTNFSNDASPVFEDTLGYLIAYKGDSIKEFSGALNLSDISISGLTNTSGNTNSGWHLIGNPFTSALIWNNGTAWNLSDIDGTAKVWNETNASYSDIYAGNKIPSMQGFMIHVSTSGSTSGSLTVDADSRSHSNKAWYKADSVNNRIELVVYDINGKTAQESVVRVIEDATKGFDTQYDSHFLPGYAPKFYSVTEDGKAVSTNTLPYIEENSVIPFVFIKNASADFYIKAEGINNLIPSKQVYLTDLKTNHTQLLNSEPIYYFTSEEGDIEERFELHFGPVGINDNISINNDINIFARDNQIEIRSKMPLTGVVMVYNVTGQLILKTAVNNQSSASINTGNFKGIAIVSVVDNKQVYNQKVLIK